MMRWKNVEALKEELLAKVGFNAKINVTNTSQNSRKRPAEYISTLEEIYWVEENHHNPWVLVRASHSLLLLCPSWINRDKSEAVEVICTQHAYVAVLRNFTGGCTCDEYGS